MHLSSRSVLKGQIGKKLIFSISLGVGKFLWAQFSRFLKPNFQEVCNELSRPAGTAGNFSMCPFLCVSVCRLSLSITHNQMQRVLYGTNHCSLGITLALQLPRVERTSWKQKAIVQPFIVFIGTREPGALSCTQHHSTEALGGHVVPSIRIPG